MATANSITSSSVSLKWDALTPQEQVLIAYYRLAPSSGQQALNVIAQAFNPPRNSATEEVSHA